MTARAASNFEERLYSRAKGVTRCWSESKFKIGEATMDVSIVTVISVLMFATVAHAQTEKVLSEEGTCCNGRNEACSS